MGHDISFQIPSIGAAVPLRGSHQSYEQASMSRLHLASHSHSKFRLKFSSSPPSPSLFLFRGPSSVLPPLFYLLARPPRLPPSLPSLPLISRSFNSFSPLKALPPSVRLHWPPTYLPRTAPADERAEGDTSKMIIPV